MGTGTNYSWTPPHRIFSDHSTNKLKRHKNFVLVVQYVSWWQYDTRLMVHAIMQYASLVQLLSIAFQFSWSWLLLGEKHYSGFVKVHLNRALSDIKVWCKISPRAAALSWWLVLVQKRGSTEGQLWCKEGAWVSNMKGRCSCNKTVRLLL